MSMCAALASAIGRLMYMGKTPIIIHKRKYTFGYMDICGLSNEKSLHPSPYILGPSNIKGLVISRALCIVSCLSVLTYTIFYTWIAHLIKPGETCACVYSSKL